MASFPPQQQPQRRRSSPVQQSSADNASQVERTTSQSPSTRSVDSQTVFLNDPIEASQSPQVQQDDDPKKCWICLNDETEDTTTTSKWKTPCPCALTAHESCLLEWVADIEAPGTNRSAAAQREIRCPQCRSEIFLARPHSYIVQAVARLEKTTRSLLLPGMLAGFTYSVCIAATHHGMHTIRMIFGPDDAAAILAPAMRHSNLEHWALINLPSITGPILQRWRGFRLELGLPLIPAALIASRTTFADSVLPFVPILFFASQPDHADLFTEHYWPPSAAMTLAALPYLRGIYDEAMERIWGEHERAWVKAVQPHVDASDSTSANANDDDDIIQVELDVEIVPDEPAPNQAPDLHDPPTDADAERDGAPNDVDRLEDIAGQVEAAVQRQEQIQAVQHQHEHEHEHEHEHAHGQVLVGPIATRIADTVLGALLFPAICGAMGGVLRRGLPGSWTTPRMVGYGLSREMVTTGLLQTKWGRSIVGGCLFVVLKDALRIYCRWKMAKAFGERRVLDYDKKIGKVVR